jgi:proton-translocating NADH-quinone oxidoreductase chain M
MILSPLTYLLAVAFLGTLATFLGGRHARLIALFTSVLALLVVLYLLTQFSFTQASGYQFLQLNTWFTYAPAPGSPGLSIDYAVGVDGISLPFLLLSAIVTVATVIYHWEESQNPSAFFGLLLLTNAGLLGVFVSLDILLFFVFWEVVLVPMFFLIGHWGGPRRQYAALKFFVYTHVASVVMLVSLLVLVFLGHWPNFDFTNMALAQGYDAAIPGVVQGVLFGALLFGFGVKLPMVPFHTWLPDAHVEAPTGGSVLLAGLLLKMGGYGLIRLAFPLLPLGRVALTPLVFFFAFLSIVWGALLSLAQRDLKRLVAYSSINHMGVVLLAIGLWTQLGVMAAVLLMFAHGLVSALLFMISGSVHHTFGTRDIPSVGGITSRTPLLSTLLMVGSLASLGLPALVSFPAEFSAFLATWETLGYWVFLPLFALVVTAAFYIWMMQRFSFGPPRGIPETARDLPPYEAIGMVVLASLIVLFGVLPFLIVHVITVSPVFGPCYHTGGGACPGLP